MPATDVGSLAIVIAEDSVLLRSGLESLVARFGHRVVGSVGDATALIDAVRDHEPDLVITDVRMPPDFTDEGLRAAVQLRRDRPDLAVIVLSQYVQQAYADELLESSGAGVGYLLKDRVAEVTQFAESIAEVAAGGTVVDPEVVRALLGSRKDPLRRLTPRELEVLDLMAQGQSNSTIADNLVVTEAAIGKHIGSLFGKLDLPPEADGNRRVLAVLAYLRGGQR
ncbi:response regulator [Microlunatus speluncae]|uniref:response regulator n=1 Tax=Microlunatus speluncae TaxID=2594267 RepID=UPI0012667D90|nr:response regulator transcription factor [Microlunatus speluncae]